MLGALPQPLEVEQVGQAWYSSPLLIAGAAIFAAILAAAVARRNHRKQLENDRVLRDREHVLDAIDRAHDGINETFPAMAQVRARANKTVEVRRHLETTEADESASDSAKDEARKALVEQRKALYTASIEAREQKIKVRTNGIRLRLRLGEHAASHHYGKFLDTLDKRVELLDEAATRNLTDAEIESEEEIQNEGTTHLGHFSTQCQDWFLKSK